MLGLTEPVPLMRFLEASKTRPSATMVYVWAMASSLETLIKYENNHQWVARFLEALEGAGEDAVEKAYETFSAYSRSRGLTKKQKSTVAKFANALNLIRTGHDDLTPTSERLVQKLFA